MNKSKPFDDIVIEQLKKDKDFAAHYLNGALIDEELHIFLVALRRVMEACRTNTTGMDRKIETVTVYESEGAGFCDDCFERFFCPVCGDDFIIQGFNYCPCCGRRIEWRKTRDG